jgi:hypothetical protein
MIPDDMGLSARRELFPVLNGYTDIVARLSDESLSIEPTHTDSHALEKWLNYNISQAQRFNADRWRAQIGFLLRNIQIDAYVIDTLLNYNNNDNHLPGINHHATMSKSNPRLDSTVAMGSGTSGYACSSLDGRDGITGGLQKQG